MNPLFSPATVLHRLAMAVVGMLLMTLCSCMQKEADPGSTFRKGVQRDAWRTQEAYDQALLNHTEKTRNKIPSGYWDPGIWQLRPIKVYPHRANLVVVQSVHDGVEKGKYIYLVTSSYRPARSYFDKPGVDGFVFRRAEGRDVYHFTRTPAFSGSGK